MLPAASRLTKSHEFSTVVRRGRRAGRSRLVIHALEPGRRAELRAAGQGARGRVGSRGQSVSRPTHGIGEPPRVGLVVSKAVGIAVVRHRVARRLRHLMRERLALLPAGTLVVVRALSPAADASSHELGTDLDAALRKLRLAAVGGERPATGSP